MSDLKEKLAQDPIVIVAAKRTAIGSFMGSLSQTPAHQMGAEVIKDVIADALIDAQDIDQVLMGQILTAGCGQNPARQAAMAAGILQEKTAMTINQVCGSGLRSVMLAASTILSGEADIIIAGGQENMSLSPHALQMRKGQKFGNATAIDTMITDGLWDCFHDYHMGETAENIAEQFEISREDQDEYAAESQKRAARALAENRFADEITPLTLKSRKGDIKFEKDEFPRADSTVENLAKLKPAFRKDGSVTAGNASGLNDGAAAVIVMRQSEAEKRGLKILAHITSYATRGVDPSLMGIGPVPASRAALDIAGWRPEELDLVESNEAFAAQSCYVMREMPFDPEKTNVNGGAIALGHPIGASGTRCLVTLIHEMHKRETAERGLVTLCIGGGMGIAMCITK